MILVFKLVQWMVRSTLCKLDLLHLTIIGDDVEQKKFEQQLQNHTEEDIALLGEPTVNFSDEDDIDDGEYWGDLEDSDINNDTENPLYPTSSEDYQPPNIPSNKEEEEHFHKALKITNFLSTVIAKFSILLLTPFQLC